MRIDEDGCLVLLYDKRSIRASAGAHLRPDRLHACDSDSAHSYVTPKDVKTVERPIAQIDDSGIKVPEKRDLKIKLADSDKATKWKIEVSDPTALEVGKSEKEHRHPAPAACAGRGRRPGRSDGLTTDFR